MKKAVEKVNKHNFNGRPLKVKEVGRAKRVGKETKISVGNFCQSNLIYIFLIRILMV